MTDRVAARRVWPAVWVGFTLALLLAGCSLVELGYHQIDWVLRQRIEQVVRLSDDQRRRLTRDIDDLLSWHCETQLPAYVALLDDLGRDVRAGLITPARVADYSERIEGYWYALLERAIPGAGRLLASLSDIQVAELLAYLDERDHASARAVRASAPVDPARDYARLGERQWQRWLGPLTAEQARLIGDWSRAFEPLGELGVDFRADLHRRLRALLTSHRGDPAGLSAGLLGLVAEIRQQPPSAYAARVDANKRLSIDMVAAVAAAATAGQEQHLLRVAGRWRADLAGVSCR